MSQGAIASIEREKGCVGEGFGREANSQIYDRRGGDSVSVAIWAWCLLRK